MKDWHGKDWRQLRTQLIKLCLHHSENLLSDLDKKGKTLVYGFIQEVANDVWSRTQQDRIGLWEQALPLLVDRDKLCDWLEADMDALTGDKLYQGKPLDPRQALGRKLSQYFEDARRSLIANELEVKPSMIKTWERLDKLSREIARELHIANRCTDEHFAELAALVKERFARDRNLPRKISTIQKYFFKFSEDCKKTVDEPDQVLENTSNHDLSEIMQGHGMDTLAICLESLMEDELEFVDVQFGLGLSKIQYRSRSDFYHTRELDEQTFKTRLNSIMAKLQDCLELSLARDARGIAT